MIQGPLIKTIAASLVFFIPVTISLPVFAAAVGDANISSVENFIKSIITVLTGIAGLVAAGFFVVGGLHYIMSSGNPEHMDKAKRTITYSALGLAITFAAFVISNIVTDLATSAFGS